MFSIKIAPGILCSTLFFILHCPAFAAVLLNSGHNTMDVTWRIRSSYIGTKDYITTYNMSDGVPAFVHGREEILFNYSEFHAGMLANFSSNNELDSISIGISISSQVSIYTDVSIAFNLSVSGSDTTIRAYFIPTGASGVAGELSLGPLAYAISSPSMATDGVDLTAGMDHRTYFTARMPAGEGSISGSILMTFDRAITAADIASLTNIPEPSITALLSMGFLTLISKRRKR